MNCEYHRLAMAFPSLFVAALAAVGGISSASPTQPPPGSKQDQVAWTAGYETHTGALLEQARARRAMLQLQSGRYYERLSSAASASPGAQAIADALTRKLAKAADDVSRAGAKPPFDLRTGCRYQLLGLENAMATARGPDGAADLAAARAELTRCRDTVERWRAPLAEADDALEKALAEADAVLARHEPSALNNDATAEVGNTADPKAR
jgi:hypothetical protein